MSEEIKDIEQSTKLSVQSRAQGAESMPGLFFVLNQGAGTVPAWWSRQRDRKLREFWRGCDFTAGAFYSLMSRLSAVPFRVEPRDPSVKAHWRMAERYEQELVEGSEFGAGWVDFFNRWLLDRWSQDNGAFAEVIGDGRPDGPIKGPAVGLANLDAGRCTRTGDPEYPVIYQDPDGQRYKLHFTRVAYASQVPSASAEMNGVGFCWLSRALGTAQHLTDILNYVQEKLGSRPLRAFMVASGVPEELVAEAVNAANEAADNANLSRLSRLPVLANPSAAAQIAIDLVDLASLPDGFDYETDVTLGVYMLAMAGGFPPRWIWPATVSGATKADAQYQHMVGTMSGAMQELRTVQMMLGGSETGRRHVQGKFLPPTLKLVFDFQDDAQDQAQAEVRSLRSDRHLVDLNAGTVDLRVVREQMLDDGDLTDAQFEDLELQSGRLPDGLPLASLFYQDVALLRGIDPEQPDPAIVESALDKARRERVSATTADAKREARQVVALLEEMQAESEQQVGDVEVEREAEGEEVEEQMPEEEFEEAQEEKQLGPAACVCPSCGHEQEKERGIPCRSVDCPECGAKMEGKVKAAKIIPTRSQDPIPAVPEEVEVTDADVQAALAWFDEAFPDLKGMLDAEVEGRVDYG